MNIAKGILKKLMAISLCVFMLAFFCSCKDEGSKISFFLSSYTELKLYGGDTRECEREIKEFLTDFESRISVNILESEVSVFNAAKAEERVQLSEHVFNVFKIALKAYNDSDKAFNPCMYALTKLWGFMPDNDNFGIIPNSDDIETCLKTIMPEQIILEEEGKTVYKKADLIQVDFGGIAKGYALGVCREIAGKHGIIGGTVYIAGNIYCIGEYNAKGEKTEKVIAVTDPRARENNSGYFGKILLGDCSVSVSGDYERYFIIDGVRYCHILNPANGKPVNNGIASVVIADKNAALADTYSTSVMVSGIERGLAFMEEKGLNGIIITSDNRYYVVGSIRLTEISDKYERAV